MKINPKRYRKYNSPIMLSCKSVCMIKIFNLLVFQHCVDFYRGNPKIINSFVFHIQNFYFNNYNEIKFFRDLQKIKNFANNCNWILSYFLKPFKSLRKYKS